MNLQKYITPRLGEPVLLKMACGLSSKGVPSSGSDQAVLILEYTPIDITQDGHAILRLRALMQTSDGKPLLTRSRHRQEVGSVTVPIDIKSDSMEVWYVMIVDAMLDMLAERESDLNSVTSWLLPRRPSTSFTLALT